MAAATATASAHEFFAASASVAGALIGLLFVALSVAPERVLGPEASEVHSVRAAATLTAFTNALTVALFSLIPGLDAGGPATAVSIVGMVFIVRALISVSPSWRAGEVRLRDLTFLVGLIVVFVVQLIAAIELDRHHNDGNALVGLNRPSQHRDRGGVDGQAGWMDERTDGQGADEVAGAPDASSGSRAVVLA